MTFRPQELTPFLSARHYFGAEMRYDREAAGLSLVQLAGIVASSKSTLARVETAELMPPPDLPPHLDAAFGNYELQIIPGLMQTREYAHSLLRVQEDLASEQIEERVAGRLSRQDRLRTPQRPMRWAIIDESILRRQVGTRECMRNQLAHLLEQVDTSDSKVQVLPFSSGPHSLMGGSLTLLPLPNGSTMAYEEGIEVGHLYEDQDSVKKWRRQYEVLRANALPMAASAELIQQALEDY
ncbi:DUF5753 domain-containing protein [Streptomyces niveiscabiei]|uniref:DUF5753 domain-containing protein n=1 Tax=Streptomyces niveiscabiei TaxID=164115 RepID=A0ABW9I4H7_9ACTN